MTTPETKGIHSHLLPQRTDTSNPFSRPQTPHHSYQIGFIGLGAMGYFMARNLANYRPPSIIPPSPILVYNRTKSKSEKLVEEVGDDKARIAENPREIAQECDFIFTNLANDDVVKDVYLPFAEALKVGAPIVTSCRSPHHTDKSSGIPIAETQDLRGDEHGIPHARRCFSWLSIMSRC